MNIKSINQVVWLSLAAIALLSTSAALSNSLQVRTKRWLEVRRIKGAVSCQRGTVTQPAQIGTRLQAIGDAITTGKHSSATLAVDTGIGSVQVSENTNLSIQQLEATTQGGRVTKLRVNSGQVRLQVRPFSNSNSQLEVATPAGISGVRGTEFGIGVQPNGKTGVATLEGNVVTGAQGHSVAVKAGWQSLVIPGEKPSEPTPLTDDTRLNIRQLTKVGQDQIRIIGQVDPVNGLIIAGHAQNTGRQGEFDLTVPLTPSQPGQERLKTQAIVTTPLGKQQIYEIFPP